ncbi:MAG: HAD family acid phosphatase [Woeseiaceae bacterium]|nr:HAD family acid phosphatase [Woeseiaceae bacterium]
MALCRTVFSSLIFFALTGCAAIDETAPETAHDNTDAVIWLQSSTEYAAATAGVYAAATTALQGMAQTAASPTSGMAIVLDVDETVLDNSPYQGQLVFDDANYGTESWDRWVALRTAAEVPGVVDFIRSAQSLGFHVVFITNRPCRARPDSTDVCPQIEDTRVNLEAIGIDTSLTTIYLRGQRPPESCRALLTTEEQADGTWSQSDKTSRRACVGLDREIVMLFGDQMGDFTEEHGASGRQTAADFDENWGRTWFMLPNPTYGGWKPRTPAEKRALMRGID